MWLFNISAWLGKIYADVTGKQLEGKPVLIKLFQTADNNLEEMITHGNIYSLPVKAFTSGPKGIEGRTEHGPGSLIIELTEESTISSLGTRWVLATPRYVGDSAYRLFIVTTVFNVHAIDTPGPSPASSYDRFVAIATIKLSRPKSRTLGRV
ncbi:MAG: hypothetical protein NW202_01420 [Nitrospira sp.]|nr:hypothetical protein [Nitrospira sp.]